MKNDLTTGAWQQDIGCPISIVLFSTSDDHFVCVSSTRLAINPRRYITDLSTNINSIGETTLELDLHADTCVLGRDALIFLDYDRPVIVKHYDPSLGTKTYATVSEALAYDDPTTGKVYHLVINQAIHIPHLDHHHICPMQCQVDDVIVNNMPKFLMSDPTDHTHALVIKTLTNLHRQSSSHWPYKVRLCYLM
jgi:hypothetical protein